MSKIYAVKKGREVGLYFSWSDCSKQVDGFQGAEFKSFSELKPATDYLIGIGENTQPQHTGFYAVKRGKTPGIYNTWVDCKEQIEGCERPVFKKFARKEDAEEWMLSREAKENSPIEHPENNKKYKRSVLAYVDGSYNEKTDVTGFGIVYIADDKSKETSSGVVAPLGMRQVNGEITAAEKAVRYAIAIGYDHITVYYDYEGVKHWAKGTWRTNKARTTEYKDAMKKLSELIAIDFEKVSAHSGVENNELADSLAKSACGM